MYHDLCFIIVSVLVIVLLGYSRIFPYYSNSTKQIKFIYPRFLFLSNSKQIEVNSKLWPEKIIIQNITSIPIWKNNIYSRFLLIRLKNKQFNAIAKNGWAFNELALYRYNIWNPLFNNYFRLLWLSKHKSKWSVSMVQPICAGLLLKCLTIHMLKRERKYKLGRKSFYYSDLLYYCLVHKKRFLHYLYEWNADARGSRQSP